MNILYSSVHRAGRSALTGCLSLFMLLVVLAPQASQAQTIFALSKNKLISFRADNPRNIWDSDPIKGVAPGQELVGLDFRPATGELFALGYNNSNGQARLYILNQNTARATAVGAAPIVLELGLGKVGFDFNPTVDRIRVTGSSNANYRLNPITGGIAATDLRLNFAAGDVNAGRNPSVGTVAYTNSYIGATATTLYNYEDSLNILTTQNPPNNGTLNTVGSSGIMVNLNDPSSDMDIWFDDATSTNWAYLAANTGNSSDDKLYKVNLATGAATLVGAIGGHNGRRVQDIAIKIKKEDSRLRGELVYAATSNGNLISFDSENPMEVRSQIAITGLVVGQALAGMDFRPATGELFALGYNPATQMGRLYRIDKMTGIASPIAPRDTMLALGSGDIGFDFNPTVDRIRVVGANNANYRMNPITGGIAATDMMLNYAAGDANAGSNPAVGSVAYTNSYAGALTTTLYDYDDSLNVIATQLPPNNGTLNTVGASGLMLNLADPSVDLDIYFDVRDSANWAYASANTGTSLFDNFYTLNLATGAASLVGKIGKGIAVRDIAVLIDTAERNHPPMSGHNLDNLRVYPNPIRNIGNISFDLDASAYVRIDVKNDCGRSADVIFQGNLAAGSHTKQWDASRERSGTYYIRVFVDGRLAAITRVKVQ